MRRFKTGIAALVIILIASFAVYAAADAPRRGQREGQGRDGVNMKMSVQRNQNFNQSEQMAELRELLEKYRKAETAEEKSKLEAQMRSVVEKTVVARTAAFEEKVKDMEAKVKSAKADKEKNTQDRFNKMIERLDRQCDAKDDDKSAKYARRDEMKNQRGTKDKVKTKEDGRGQNRAGNQAIAEKQRAKQEEVRAAAAEMRELAASYKTAETPAEKEAVKNQIKALMDKTAAARISAFENALAEMKKKLNDMKANQSKIVDERLAGIIARGGGYGEGKGRGPGGEGQGKGREQGQSEGRGQGQGRGRK